MEDLINTCGDHHLEWETKVGGDSHKTVKKVKSPFTSHSKMTLRFCIIVGIHCSQSEIRYSETNVHINIDWGEWKRILWQVIGR